MNDTDRTTPMAVTTADTAPAATAEATADATAVLVPPAARVVDWTHELLDQLAWHWLHHVRPRLDGLTDAEYLWEPVPGCWSLRPRASASTAMAAGAGDVVADFEMPEPDPSPITTIAWRLGHISIGIFGERAANHFGAGPVSYAGTDWPLTAAGGLALLDEMYDRWVTGVRTLDADALAAPCGPAEGPFAEYSIAALVLHINREAIHHAAEVLLLRDLYRHGGGRTPTDGRASRGIGDLAAGTSA